MYRLSVSVKAQSNEQIVWNLLHKCRNGISVNDLAFKSCVSKPTLIKILRRFKESGNIVYPKQKRGKRTVVILTKFTLKDNFSTVRKLRQEIENRFNSPIIIQTKNGRVFAGLIDNYGGRTLFLYYGEKMMPNNEWKKLENQSDQPFFLGNIAKIYEPNYENLGLEEIALRDTIELWTNYNHRIQKGIYCDWSREEGSAHSKECDAIIHESLVELYTNAQLHGGNTQEKHEKLANHLGNLVLYVLSKGGKIPYDNY